MIIPGIKESHSQQILKLFNDLPKDTDLILFGSRAKNTHREGSDIDLALKGNSATLEDCDKLKSRYDELFLPWKLDLVVYNLIQDQGLRDHIDRIGIKLRCKRN